MTEPKLLSREELESAMADTHWLERLKDHIAALEKSLENARKDRDDLSRQVEGMHEALNQRTKDMKDAEDERDAALADNAAWTDAVTPLLSLPYALEAATVPAAGVDAAPEQVVGTLHVSLAKIRTLRAVHAQPHPGATLLEEHRKVVETLKADLSAALRWAPTSPTEALTMLRNHAKALVRARNEGLEQAKVVCTEVYREHKKSGSYPMDMGGLAIECRDRIDAKKEPEQ